MENISYELFFLGLFLISFLGIKGLLNKFHLSPIVGYLFLGWILRILHEQHDMVTVSMTHSLKVLANIGLIFLLFQIGLDSQIKKLLKLLKKVWMLGVGNILFTGILCFAVAYIMGIAPLVSAYIALAFSATSISVAISSWNRGLHLKSRVERICLDLALLDDLIIIFGLIVFTHFFGMGETHNHSLWIKSIIFVVKLLIFFFACTLFSLIFEPYFTKLLIKYERMPDSMLSVLGMGLVVASIALLFGFSLAIGAFFAGIAFSRDPKAVKMEASMKPILDFFVPFFFFWVGYQISLHAMTGSWLIFGALLFAALIGKFFGTFIPAKWAHLSAKDATLVAFSMVPRAEVAMVVLQLGWQYNCFSKGLYSALVIIILISCLIPAIGIRATHHLAPAKKRG